MAQRARVDQQVFDGNDAYALALVDHFRQINQDLDELRSFRNLGVNLLKYSYVRQAFRQIVRMYHIPADAPIHQLELMLERAREHFITNGERFGELAESLISRLLAVKSSTFGQVRQSIFFDQLPYPLGAYIDNTIEEINALINKKYYYFSMKRSERANLGQQLWIRQNGDRVTNMLVQMLLRQSQWTPNLIFRSITI